MSEQGNTTDDVLKDRKQEKAEKDDGAAKSAVKDTADQLTKKQRKELKKKFKAARKKAIKTALKTGGATVGAIIVMVLVAVFMIVGILVFVVSTPGMIQEGLMAKFDEVIGGISNILLGDNHQLEKVSDEKKLEVLQYIQDMGIDVVGYGFVATADVNSDGEVVAFQEEYLNDEKLEVKNMTLYNYILASQRIYALNKNGVIGSVFDVNDQSGMLNITNEGFLDGIETSVDLSNKRLNITVNNPHWDAWLNEDGFSYNLNGWSGRYGIPLDFTISLHLATMSSGILNEIITHPDLQTSVNIELKEVNASVEYKLQTTDGSNVEIAYDNGVNLYSKYVESGGNINKNDISIVGLVELANILQTEPKDTSQVYCGEDLIGDTGYSFGGLKKNIDAAKALIGSGEFLCVPDASIYNKAGIAETSSISTGTYICDYNESTNTIDESTGIIGTKIVSNKATESGTQNSMIEYKNKDGVYYYYINDEIDDEKKVLALSQEDKESNTNHFEYISLNGLNKSKATLATITSLACKENNTEDISSILRENSINVNANQSINIDKSSTTYKLFGYYRMFEQVDHFIAGYTIQEMANRTADRKIDDDELARLSKEFHYDFTNYSKYDKNGRIGGYYTSLFEKMCKNQDFTELDDLIKDLNEDIDKINSYIVENSKILDEVISNAGYEGLSMDMVNTVYVNARLNNNDVNFVQPRIQSVIRHWFKDVDFSANNTYKLTNSAYETKYTGESGLDEEKYVITAVIDPNDNSEYYTQNGRQPYVVKGDVVSLDGKVVEDTSVLTPLDEDDGYEWGDGYRATKKIFTQGSYYTYDGSDLTTRSIYYQEQIENMSNQICYIAVRSGRITVFSGAIPNGEERDIGGKTITNIGYKNGNWTSEVLDNTTEVDSGVENVKIVHVGKTQKHVGKTQKQGNEENDENTNTTDIVQEVNWYLLYIGNKAIEYKSPARDNNTYETSQKSVRNINNVWNAVGVISLRKPVSFDNVVSNENDDINSDGNLMAQTAFAILENSKSEDAEVIYRDLKELLIDLGYYTKAEFDYLSTNVLNWFIPDYLPKQWPQNGDDDVMQYGAFLYPYAEETDEDEQTDESNEEKIEGREDGFSPDLDIIAPGNCRIIDYSSDSIKIRFDGVSQPEIGILNNYTMIIKGIVTNSELTITGEDESETVISIKDAKDNNENTIIPSGTVIGKTGNSKIQVVMKNNRSAIINNIEDYMAPELREATNYGEVIEYATEFINSFEGTSDADPNDGDFYTVSPKNNNPGNDIDTIGAGLTGWTYPFWESLGYGNYVINNPDYR